MKRTPLLIFLAILAGCTALGILMMVSARNQFTDESFLTLVLIALATILFFSSWMMWGYKKLGLLGLVGMVAAIIAVTLSMFPTWGEAWFRGYAYATPRPWWYSSGIFRCIGMSWVAAGIIPYLGLLSLPRLHRNLRWAR